MMINYITNVIKYVKSISKYSRQLSIIILLEKVLRLIYLPFKKIFSTKDLFIIGFNYEIQNAYGNYYIRAGTDDEYIISPFFEKELYPYFTLSPGKYFLDIGSHIGKYSIYTGILFPKSNVIAFEGNSQTYKSLQINKTLNNLSNLTTEHCLIGGDNKEVEFLEASKNTGISRVVSDHGGELLSNNVIGQSEFSISKRYAITIDQYLARKSINHSEVGLIKIDVEGQEYNVLKGMENLIINNQHITIIIEITENLSEIMEYMQNLGYHSEKINPTYFVFLTKK